jgi:hypothetical protein
MLVRVEVSFGFEKVENWMKIIWKQTSLAASKLFNFKYHAHQVGSDATKN